MLEDVLNQSKTAIAAFLDVDGTLLDIAATPDTVNVPPHVPELLYRLWLHLDGAVALVSGRSLEDVDRLFSPYRFPGVGTHGCEVRESSGCVAIGNVDPLAVHELHEEIGMFEFCAPGILVEYKPFGAAVHYRLSPEAEPEVATAVHSTLAKLGSSFSLQRGKYVYEIKPTGFSKGRAIRALMEQWPFQGRHPLFIGDDQTDESGFEAVNLAGGTSVRVGPSSEISLARHSVGTPAQVHALLAALVRESGD